MSGAPPPPHGRMYRYWLQYAYQGGLCCWCLKPMDLLPRYKSIHPDRSPTRATREHVFPVSLGGARGWHNCVLAHADCNHERDADATRKPHFDPVARPPGKQTSPVADAVAERTICLDIPVRNGYASVQLPDNLTLAEASLICAAIWKEATRGAHGAEALLSHRTVT